MVRIRENTHKHLTRHAVTAVLVRTALPALMVKVWNATMIVDRRKEAAP